MNQKDYYKILGVEESASAEAIKKAYRKLAKDNHPDANAGDKQAEQRFKEVSEAYSILNDSKKRQQYDQFRRLGMNGAHAGGGFNPGTAGFNMEDLFGGFAGGHSGGRRGAEFDLDHVFGFDNLSDMFGQIFDNQDRGGTRRRRAKESLHIHLTLQIPFKTAALGGKTSFKVPEKGTKKFAINIAPGTQDGKKLKLAGQGRPDARSGRVGDLILHVSVGKDRFFEMRGLDIFCNVPLQADQAAEGTKIRVKTIHSNTVELRVPPDSADGQKLKLKGMGIRCGKRVGDQYVTIKVAA